MKEMVLTEIDLKRYSRQVMLDEVGVEGQIKLINSKVLVVGAGGLGSPVLQYLTSAGIGTIGICDNDYVEENSFNRQMLYGTSDIGKLKTIVAKEKLQLMNPSVNFSIHNILLNVDITSNLISQYDVIIDCTDNFQSKFIIDSACKEKHIPFIFGYVERYEGYLSVFDYRRKRLNDLEYFVKNFMPEFLIPKEKKSGILGVVPGIMGTLQANEAIKNLLNTGTNLIGKVLVFNALQTEFRTINF